MGDIAAQHTSDVGSLVDELLPLLRRELEAVAAYRPGALGASRALRDHDAVLRALLEYSESIGEAVPSRTMALSEMKWRNGALLRLGMTPVHCSWLTRAGVDPKEFN